MYPQLWFSRAMRSISTATASSTGGRPRWWGYVHFLATRRRCQRRIVTGVTRRCPRSICGSLRTSAANTARSAQPRRGFWVGSAQYGDFVTQHEKLDVLGRRRAGEQQQQVHQLKEDQVEQTPGHGSRSYRGVTTGGDHAG